MNVRWEASNLTTLGGSHLMAMLLAVSLMGGVTSGVIFFTGDGDAEGERLVAWIGIAVLVVFGALGYLAAQRARARIRVGWDGDAVCLEIRGPRGEATLRGPFRVDRGWVREAIATGRGSVRNTVVMIAIEDEAGRTVLYLREQLGAIYSPPPGWPQRMVIARTPCQHVYTNSLGTLDLAKLAEAIAPTRE